MNGVWPVLIIAGVVLAADVRSLPTSSQRVVTIPSGRSTPVAHAEIALPLHYVCTRPDRQSATIVLTPVEEGAGAEPLRLSCVNCSCDEAK
jgi:hypothetical protein